MLPSFQRIWAGVFLFSLYNPISRVLTIQLKWKILRIKSSLTSLIAKTGNLQPQLFLSEITAIMSCHGAVGLISPVNLHFMNQLDTKWLFLFLYVIYAVCIDNLLSILPIVEFVGTCMVWQSVSIGFSRADMLAIHILLY